REVIEELQGVVIIRVRTLGAVADSVVVDQGHIRQTPLHRVAALQPGDADLADGVRRACQERADRVEESRVTETDLVYGIVRKGARVRAHVLLEIRQDLGAVKR